MKSGKRYSKCKRAADFPDTHSTAEEKEKQTELAKVCLTYHFSRGGGEHVSGRCHVRRSVSAAGTQQGLDAVVGDKESSSCNRAEPQPFEAH